MLPQFIWLLHISHLHKNVLDGGRKSQLVHWRARTGLSWSQCHDTATPWGFSRLIRRHASTQAISQVQRTIVDSLNLWANPSSNNPKGLPFFENQHENVNSKIGTWCDRKGAPTSGQSFPCHAQRDLLYVRWNRGKVLVFHKCPTFSYQKVKKYH